VGKFKKADLKVPLAEAVGAKPGYYVSMELTEYFRSTYGKPVRFGVTQSVGFSATKINFERSYQGEENLSMVDLKSGFILSANVGPGIAADFYFRAGAVSYASTSSFGTAFGTNVRLKWLIGSLSVNTGKLNATNIVGGVSSPAYNIPATSVKLGLGIKLGKA
jgi:hypothetical protein